MGQDRAPVVKEVYLFVTKKGGLRDGIVSFFG